MKRAQQRKGSRTQEQDAARVKFGLCPKGHTLPHRTNRGRCTPMRCADEGGAVRGSKAKSSSTRAKRETQRSIQKALKEGVDPLLEAKLGDVPADVRDLARVNAIEMRTDSIARMGQAIARLAARHAYLKVPQGLKGADAEAWADAKIAELLPMAVAEKEYQLLLGDDKQRSEAADRILDANGRGKRDGFQGGGATIILMGAQPGQAVIAPWRAGPAKRLIEGEVIPKDET